MVLNERIDRFLIPARPPPSRPTFIDELHRRVADAHVNEPGIPLAPFAFGDFLQDTPQVFEDFIMLDRPRQGRGGARLQVRLP